MKLTSTVGCVLSAMSALSVMPTKSIMGIATASAEVLDIDPLIGMANNPGSPVPRVSQITDEFLSQGVQLSSNGGFVAVAKGIGVHWFPDPKLLNGLGGSDSSGNLSYDSPVIFKFVNPAAPTVPWITTSFSLSTDYQGIGTVCSLIAYDRHGKVVDSDVKPEQSGNQPTGTPYSVAGAGITEVHFVGAGTQAVSNIQFADPQPACVGDLNGDEIVDGADIAILLGGWGECVDCACAACLADLNPDCTVDGADIAVLLGAWGPCS